MNVTGVSVGSIKNAISSDVEPDTTERLGNLLEYLNDLSTDYGNRMKGWLVPPITGEYIFWISATCQSELWLSTDDKPKNGVLSYASRKLPLPGRGCGYTLLRNQKQLRLLLVGFITLRYEGCEIIIRGYTFFDVLRLDTSYPSCKI